MTTDVMLESLSGPAFLFHGRTPHLPPPCHFNIQVEQVSCIGTNTPVRLSDAARFSRFTWFWSVKTFTGRLKYRRAGETKTNMQNAAIYYLLTQPENKKIKSLRQPFLIFAFHLWRFRGMFKEKKNHFILILMSERCGRLCMEGRLCPRREKRHKHAEHHRSFRSR